MTEPLPEDTLVAGPSVLNMYASIDQVDTNWIIVLKDVGPDVSVRTAREGENQVPADLPEREIVRGWLKASHRAIDPTRSKPWKPWHPLTRAAQRPVVPAEVTEYNIELLSTANLFKRGHRICIDITSMDMPTGTAGFTNVEYFPYHICSSKTTLHKVYHGEKYPSHLLLPVVRNADDA
jgi:predicted acyl esterase